METRANHLLIGSFVVGVVLLALGCLLWLGKFGGERDTALYDIVFKESVIGLSKGSVVSYNGVTVGEVVSLGIDPKSLSRVVVRVRINGRELLREGARATLGFSAVTSVADIRLSGGSLKNPPLFDPKRPDVVPVLVASPSPLSKLADSGEDIMVNINEVASRLADVLAPENVAHVSAVLGHVEQLTASLADEREGVSVAVRQLADTSAQLSQTLISIEEAARSVRNLADDQASELVASVRQTVERLDALVLQMDGLVGENRAALSDFSNQGLRQVGPALDDLRATLTTVQQLAEQLSRSDSLLLGNPQPKEFKPR